MALLLHNAYLADSSQICLTIWLNTWVIYHNPEKLENRHGPKCLPCKVSRLKCVAPQQNFCHKYQVEFCGHSPGSVVISQICDFSFLLKMRISLTLPLLLVFITKNLVKLPPSSAPNVLSFGYTLDSSGSMSPFGWLDRQQSTDKHNGEPTLENILLVPLSA